MDIKNYLQYYIGHARFRYRYFDYADDEWGIWVKLTPKRYLQVTEDASISAIQLELRPLEDMTREEAEGLVTLVTPKERWEDIEILYIEKNRLHYMDGSKWYGDGVEEFNDLYVYYEQLNAVQFNYLLSRAFDIFGLIPAGLAEAKKQNP